ncbi:ATP-binding protein [Amycolatopsis orientalis]|uniref:ATP-binding protein n=1 Tax=Amycolatopsis orientalis TaxID=31958 RepID=UPI00040F38D9|nr:helix-turn-helix domain-containing protein [Amycolatopsis orientalis]
MAGLRIVDKTAFGDFLRFYRLRIPMTQEELAERTGISVRSISDMERGRVRTPQRRTAELLTEGLGLTGKEAGDFTDLARSGRRPVAAKEEEAVPAETPRPVLVTGLPPHLTELTGRKAEQRLLDEVAESSASSSRLQVAVVHGLPGAGKTALAVDAGHRHAHRFAQGCLFLDLRGMDPEPLSPDRAVHRLLRGFGLDERQFPTDPEDRLALYHSLVHDREVLLILDNAANEAQVRPLLTTSPGSMVLVTSRSTLAGLNARHRLALDVLSGDEAVDLLGVIAGKRRPQAEPDAARRVAQLCGGVPLALLIAGNRLASRPQWTIAHLADQLENERRRLSVLTAGDLQIRTAFALSYQHLAPETARVFRRLALLDGPDVSVELAAVAAGRPEDEVEASLEKLADASLLGCGGTPGRYTTLDLLRVFAKERLTTTERAEEIEAAGDRVRNWLLTVATKAAQFFDHDRAEVTIAVEGPDPVHDRESAALWLSREQHHWRGALRSAAALGAHEQVLELATAMHWYSDLRGTGPLWREVFGAGAAAAEALGDVRSAGEQLNYVSWAHYALCGDPHAGLEAHRRAVAAATEAGDLVAQAWAWYYGSAISRRLGDPREAAVLSRRSVELFEQADYQNGRHLALSLLGSMLHTLGDFDGAVAVQRRSEAYYRGWGGGPGNDELLSMVLTRLADSLAATGEVTTALELLNEAESLFRKHGATFAVAKAQHLRGRILVKADRLDEAEEQLLSALAEARWSETKIEIMVELAALTEAAGKPAEAKAHRVHALAECARYETPLARKLGHALATELGVAVPESA